MQICNRPRLDNHVEKYMLINVLKEILPVWLFQHVPKESDDHVKVSVRQLLGNLRTDLRGRIIIRGKLYMIMPHTKVKHKLAGAGNTTQP